MVYRHARTISDLTCVAMVLLAKKKMGRRTQRLERTADAAAQPRSRYASARKACKALNKLTGNERLTLSLSAAAFLVSLLALYFQYFYASQQLDGAVVDFKGSRENITLRSALVNSGNKTLLIVNARAVMVKERPKSIHFMDEADTEDSLPVLIEPGGVLLVEAKLSSRALGKFRDIAMLQASTESARGTKIGVSFLVIDSKGEQYQSTPLLSTFFFSKDGLESGIINLEPVNLLDSGIKNENYIIGFPRIFNPKAVTEP